MDIQIFNTKSREKEPFTPIKAGEVSIYHCGPTVYNFQHIGNMRRFVFADLVHRLFVANDFKVKQVINITDVGHLVSDQDDGEDKMEKGAAREGKSAKEIADFYTADFMSDLALLNISTADTQFPRATDYINEQIALVKALEQKGFIYAIDDGVYFDTAKDDVYGDFANLDIKGLQEGVRVEANTQKKNITDFALWKFSKPEEKRQQEWESPWGVGFPGWHLECSAMIKALLGNSIDVHTGGIDHIPVHHTNEIAQSEVANGSPLAYYWMHNEHLNFGKEKMAKSGESFIRLKDLVEKGYNPLAYRYYTLLAHYQTKIDFSFDALDAATVAWKKINEFVAKSEDGGNISEANVALAHEAFNDNLNTPKVVALIWEIIKESSLNDADKKATILEINKLLGIIDPAYKAIENISIDSLPEEIQALITERQKAREEKDWASSDAIRDTLKEKGYEVKDVATGIEVVKI